MPAKRPYTNEAKQDTSDKLWQLRMSAYNAMAQVNNHLNMTDPLYRDLNHIFDQIEEVIKRANTQYSIPELKPPTQRP